MFLALGYWVLVYAQLPELFVTMSKKGSRFLFIGTNQGLKGEIFMERFKKVYNQGKIDVIEIWVDTETGVNYVFHRNGNAAGFTPLLDKEGKPIVTP